MAFDYDRHKNRMADAYALLDEHIPPLVEELLYLRAEIADAKISRSPDRWERWISEMERRGAVYCYVADMIRMAQQAEEQEIEWLSHTAASELRAVAAEEAMNRNDPLNP